MLCLSVYTRSTMALMNVVELIVWVPILATLFTSCMTLSRYLSQLDLNLQYGYNNSTLLTGLL